MRCLEERQRMSENRELRLFDIMDKYNVNMDVAELILQDEENEGKLKELFDKSKAVPDGWKLFDDSNSKGKSSEQKPKKKAYIISADLEKAVDQKAYSIYESLKSECKTYGELEEKIAEYRRDAIRESRRSNIEISSRLMEAFRKDIKNIRLGKVFYLCDGKVPGCKGANCVLRGMVSEGCTHTSDIEHAKNFDGRKGGNFYEIKEEKPHETDPNNHRP